MTMVTVFSVRNLSVLEVSLRILVPLSSIIGGSLSDDQERVSISGARGRRAIIADFTYPGVIGKLLVWSRIISGKWKITTCKKDKIIIIEEILLECTFF